MNKAEKARDSANNELRAETQKQNQRI